MKVTINDIAKAAGVSKATISKVINNSPSIPLTTKERIRTIMKEMNYIPNAHATLLAKRTSNTVAYILCADNEAVFKDTFVFSIIGGCNKYLFDKHYDLNFCSLSKNVNIDQFLRKFVYSGMYAGILISNELCSTELLTKLNEINYPYVIIGFYPNEIKSDNIEIDNETGGKIATEYLIQKNLKNIYYIGQATFPFAINRVNGYKKAMATANLEEKIILVNDNYHNIASIDILDNYIPKDFRAEAIVSSDNLIASLLLKYLNERQIRIPKDTKLITFDNTIIAQYSIPALSTVDIDTYKLGFTAAEILISYITAKTSDKKTVLIKPIIIERESSI